MSASRFWTATNPEIQITTGGGGSGGGGGRGRDKPKKGKGGGWTGRRGGGWGSGGSGGVEVELAWDFTSNDKMLYAYRNEQVEETATDGWAFYADYTYDGGNDRYLIGLDVRQAFSVSIHGGQLRVSNITAYSFGSTTDFTSGRYRILIIFASGTLKVWITPEGGSRVLEINTSKAFTLNRTSHAQLGGAFPQIANGGLSRNPLMGLVYQIAYWGNEMSETDGLELIDGTKTIGDISPVPNWWPDTQNDGRDAGTTALSVKSFGAVRVLTAPSDIVSFRILRDPETGAPVLYDAGSGAKYWAVYNNLTTDMYLTYSTDLETWTLGNQLFSAEADGLRTSDFLYLGNISGGHDPFLLLTVSDIGPSSASEIYARTSSDLSSWTFDLGAAPMFANLNLSSSGVEDFVLTRYGGSWLAVYAHILTDGTVHIGIAESTDTLPSSGWLNVNDRAFTTPDFGFNASNVRYVSNPVCISKDGVFWLFYRGHDTDGLTRTLANTLMRKSTNPKSQSAWDEYGMVFYHLGRKCYPDSIAIEGGEIAVYFQGGLGTLLADGLGLTKVEYDQSFLLTAGDP